MLSWDDVDATGRSQLAKWSQCNSNWDLTVRSVKSSLGPSSILTRFRDSLSQMYISCRCFCAEPGRIKVQATIQLMCVLSICKQTYHPQHTPHPRWNSMLPTRYGWLNPGICDLISDWFHHLFGWQSTSEWFDLLRSLLSHCKVVSVISKPKDFICK